MRILLIYTGGTIGMIKDEINDCLVPGGVISITRFLKEENLEQDIDVLTTKNLIDSSNFGLNYYTELATIVEKEYCNYDGFLILMGTDTMAYVSSLLSYCIKGLSKSIVFTGGQLSLVTENSDSVNNLKNSIKGIQKGQFPKEVGIYFHEKWHRAVCSTKIDSTEFDAYYHAPTINIPVLNAHETFGICTKIVGNIVVLKLTPFGNEAALSLILKSKSIDGIVIEAFGAGNMPDFSNELKIAFKKRIKEGLKVVVKSQCLKGGVSIGKYETSLEAKELSFIGAGNMTIESTVAKMLFLFNEKLNSQEYKILFEDSLKGE